MADKHSILKSIKVLLGLEEMPSPAYTLADGTPVEISELVLGGTVIVGDGPAPAGEHTLSDGQTIVVDENGVITEIKPAGVEGLGDEPKPEEPAPQAPTEMTKATIEQMVKDAVKEAVGEQMKTYTTGMQKQDEAFKSMVALMEEVLKMPTVKSDPPKQAFVKTNPESKTEKYGKILKQFQTIKN
jgi:hypothetical protein